MSLPQSCQFSHHESQQLLSGRSGWGGGQRSQVTVAPVTPKTTGDSCPTLNTIICCSLSFLTFCFCAIRDFLPLLCNFRFYADMALQVRSPVKLLSSFRYISAIKSRRDLFLEGIHVRKHPSRQAATGSCFGGGGEGIGVDYRDRKSAQRD